MRYDSRECDLRKQKLGVQSGSGLPRNIDLAVQKNHHLPPAASDFLQVGGLPSTLILTFALGDLNFYP